MHATPFIVQTLATSTITPFLFDFFLNKGVWIHLSTKDLQNKEFSVKL